MANRDIKVLDEMIAVLIKVVGEAPGPISQNDAMRTAARKLGVSVSEMPYVVNSAVAENLLESDLRASTLSVIY